ncbi:MAG: hypothetical protein U0892_16790 [Pirellulales bacterium]
MRHNVEDCPPGLVTPLSVRVNQSESTQVSRYLPFDEFKLRWVIDQLICGSKNSPQLPFTFLHAFQMSEDLNEHATGSSMDIAGALAIIDACSNHNSALLRKACSVVLPDGDSLCEVEHVAEKLDAFEREFGYGSLLVCERNGWAAENFSDRFEAVWEVSTFRDLAKKLNDENLLQPLLQENRLTSSKWETAKRYLRFLELEIGPRHAVDYARRIESHAGGCSVKTRLGLLEVQADLNRHTGNTERAVSYAREFASKLEELSEFTSFQQHCHAQILVAAGNYDLHEFHVARDLLTPLLRQVCERRDLINADTRVALNNTLARCLVILQEDGWEQLFLESLKIQEAVDPESYSRTGCYLVQGYLRANRLEDAAKRLQELAPQAMENRYLCFCAQDYLRRGGKREPFVDQILESNTSARGHARGMFFQARARTQLDASNAAADFRSAEKEFESECKYQDSSNLLHLFKRMMRLAASALDGEPVALEASHEELVSHFENATSPAVRQWYAYDPTTLPAYRTVEKLLESCPYF